MIPYPEEDSTPRAPVLDDLNLPPKGNRSVKAEDWIKYDENGVKGRLETDTMPQWAGSSWYF